MAFKNFLSKAKDVDILASVPDGLILIDNDGKIEWTNNVLPEILKYSKNKISCSDINEVIESGLDIAKQAAQSKKSVIGRVKEKDSLKDSYVEITANEVGDFILLALRDITQNYKVITNILSEHEGSKKVSKDKNLFLLKLSNELKSPLHSIIGFSQAMVDGLGGEMSEKQEKYIKIINKNSNELLKLLDKILDLSKTESNLFESEFQIFDITNTILMSLKNYEQTIKEKSLNLNFDSQELVKKTIFSDENAVKTILENLLDVSVTSTDIGSVNIKVCNPELEFAAQQGVDIVENATESSYLMIKISDTGAGINENDLGVIFEPYAQLNRANKKTIVRSIALASAKNLVKFLGGAIWIESEPMQGTVYNVIIPIEKFN